MPLPLIPIIGGAASLIAGAVGIKKGLDAKKRFEEARNIGKRAERRHRQAIDELEQKRTAMFEQLQALGEKKAIIFESSARYVVDQVKQARATAELAEIEINTLSEEDIATLERDISELSTIGIGVGKGAALAALGASGVYSTVVALASASTGTAIASLSGAAATNATLAWLGGGSLATGGLGIAGGTWVLGGVIAGPALAIAGFSLASQAEEALTEAHEFSAEVKEKIAALAPIHAMLDGLGKNIAETGAVLDRLAAAFAQAQTYYEKELKKADSWWKTKSMKQQATEAVQVHLGRLIAIFKAIKETVQTPLLDDNAMPAVGLKERYGRTLEVCDIPLLPTPEGKDA